MKKLLRKGKSLIACVSAVSILAVSLLSVFTGVSIDANAFTATRTLTDTWDGTYDYEFAVNNQGDGTVDNPYIITTAEQLAAILVPGIIDENGDPINTAGKYFKIADGIKAFYMNGGSELAAATSVAEVTEYFEETNPNANYTPNNSNNCFAGTFDGNGIVIYGLRGDVKSSGLFPYVAGDVTIKNVALRNSYISGSWFTGGLVGSANGNLACTSVTIKNCEVSNNRIAQTGANADRTASGLIGYSYNGSAGGFVALTVENCLIYGNEMTSAGSIAPSAIGSFGYGTVSLKNNVFLGCSPYFSYIAGSGTPSKYSNCYTDQDLTATGQVYTDAQLKKVENTTGAAAKEAMPALNENIWFFNKTTYPQLRIFHDFTATDNGDGTHGALTCCCGYEGLEASNAHEFDETQNCKVCGYEYPCKSGHNFVVVPAVDATVSSEGNIEYKRCTQCEKNYAFDAAVNAPADSALSDAQVIIQKIIPYDEWDGTYDYDFAAENRGNGTVDNPYIITTAEQLATILVPSITDKNGDPIDTAGKYFKIADGIKAFYMNGGSELAAATSVAEVTEYFEETNPNANYTPNNSNNCFAGTFDGNGIVIYGLRGDVKSSGLFPYVAGDVTIKNVALRNSYISGSWFAGGLIGSANGSLACNSVTIKNCEVSNNRIAYTGTSTDRTSGGLTGYGWNGILGKLVTLIVDNCLVYGNDMTASGGIAPSSIGCFGYGSGESFSNSVFLGYSPYFSHFSGSGTPSKYSNCYTDQDLTATGQTYSDVQLKKVEYTTGEQAKAEMPELKDSVWFFNKTTYPQLKVFHTFTATDNGDGTHGVLTCCCGYEGLEASNAHEFDETQNCKICGYEYPCKDGHEFEDVDAKEATLEEEGNIAYKKCKKCKKNFFPDAALDAPSDSAITDKQIIVPKMSATDEWDGTYDTTFWMYNEGDGSVDKPFTVTTAEQLAAIVTGKLEYDPEESKSAHFDINKYTVTGSILDTANLNFKVKTGVTAFYMNGGEALSQLTDMTQIKEYFEVTNTAANALVADNTKFFKGIFDGNGVTVYGVRGDSKVAALFPYVAGDVVIKNLTLKNSYLAGGYFAAGIVGGANSKEGAKTITIRNCEVSHNYIAHTDTNADRSAAGFLGYGWNGSGFVNIVLKDSIVHSNEMTSAGGNVPVGVAGSFGNASDKFTNCVFIGCAPYMTFGQSQNTTKAPNLYVGCYTDADLSTSDNTYAENQLKQLETDDMKGEKAEENMPELNWVSMWQTNKNTYPSPRLLNVKEYSAGNAWSGETAIEFPAGDGTINNPYQISAPEHLALMLKSETTGIYYEIVADIMINDTSADDWKENAKQWFTSDDISQFNGYLEGNGHTISGLYYSDVESGVSAGIIPVKGSGDVSNIIVKDSYLSGENDAYIGAVIGSVVSNLEKPIIIQGITVENSVVIEGNVTAGSVVAKVGESIVRIGNSISKANIPASDTTGGIVGIASQGTSIKNSISVGIAPVGQTNSAVVKNVYTDAQTTTEGVTVLTSDEMKGDAAAQNMSKLDFEEVWTTAANDYPVLSGMIVITEGVKGDVWSGNIANSYAGGDGSLENPYLIATAEQLAKCVVKHEREKHYKLVADIYLNDVDSVFWETKTGCNQWFSNQDRAAWNLFQKGSFDGDGYIVHGLYYERTGIKEKDKGAYLALFPTIGEAALIQNLGISQAYIAGSTYYEPGVFSENAGTIVGIVMDWDDVTLPSTSQSKKITSDPEYQKRMPIIRNCFADQTCYISASFPGGILGYASGTFRMYDCIFTGSLEANDPENMGGMAGQDTCNGSYYINCVSLPQTCDRPYGGWANSNWRNNEADWPTTVEKGYYFSKYNRVNSGTKIDNPSQRIGEEARTAMPELDWENTWMVIEDGTPLQQIFAKHRSLEELAVYSDRNFKSPFVTVTFITGVQGSENYESTGRMYSPITMPEPTREGFVFTGWYVFDDLSIEYPYDFYPPRDLDLFAGWEPTGLIQRFDEAFTNSMYDYNSEQWILNKPGAKGGYKAEYVRSSPRSMHLLDTNTDTADVLLNYEDMLRIGQTYKMTFWVTTDKANNPDTLLQLVHNEYPEYIKSNKGVEDIVTVTGLKVGEWTQYSFEFTARTPWVSLRAGANSSLYFDDFIFGKVGEDVGDDELIKYLSNLTSVDTILNADGDYISPNTGDNVMVYLVSVIVFCAVIIIISRKNPIEIIEK